MAERDLSGQLARFVHVVRREASEHRDLDALEEEALGMLVQALVGAGDLRRPSVGTMEEWCSVLERLRELGYLSGKGMWYYPTLAGVRRGLLLLQEGDLPVTSIETLRAATGVMKGRRADAVQDATSAESLVPLPHCRMLTGHSSDDPTPDVECGALATHVFVKDPEHFCCARCYEAMAYDPDVQAEYRPLSTSAKELDPVEAMERVLEARGIPT